jgi:hypothetical protein
MKIVILKRALASGLLAILLLVATAGVGSGCATYTVYIHDKETDYNHYVLLRNGAIRETLWDCYSRPGKKWDPTCVRVKMKRAVHEE